MYTCLAHDQFQINNEHTKSFNNNHESHIKNFLAKINHMYNHIIVDSSQYVLLLSNAGTRLDKALSDH